MDLGIRGRTALVTASSAGMGLNLAHTLASEGANIVLLARDASRLEAAAADVERQHGVVVHAVAGSMRDPGAVSRLATVLKPLRGPDIVVLVTGRPPTPLRDTVDETDLGRWRTRVREPARGRDQRRQWRPTADALAPHGRIVAITSAHAKSPVPGHALSSVFRAGVTAYLKSLSTEVAPDGITVNCVAPALIDTSHRTGQDGLHGRADRAPQDPDPPGSDGHAGRASCRRCLSVFTTGGIPDRHDGDRRRRHEHVPVLNHTLSPNVHLEYGRTIVSPKNRESHHDQ